MKFSVHHEGLIPEPFRWVTYLSNSNIVTHAFAKENTDGYLATGKALCGVEADPKANIFTSNMPRCTGCLEAAKPIENAIMAEYSRRCKRRSIIADLVDELEPLSNDAIRSITLGINNNFAFKHCDNKGQDSR